MTRTAHGKIHGKTIELDEDLGVAEGQEVEVQVTMIGLKKRLPGPPPGGWRPGGHGDRRRHVMAGSTGPKRMTGFSRRSNEICHRSASTREAR